MIWSGSRFVAAGDEGTILTSPDGTSWTQRVSGTAFSLNDLSWNGKGYIAVGQGGAVLTSADGAAWTALESRTRDYLLSVAWTGSRYVAMGVGFPYEPSLTPAPTARPGNPFRCGPAIR